MGVDGFYDGVQTGEVTNIFGHRLYISPAATLDEVLRASALLTEPPRGPVRRRASLTGARASSWPAQHARSS